MNYTNFYGEDKWSHDQHNYGTNAPQDQSTFSQFYQPQASSPWDPQRRVSGPFTSSLLGLSQTSTPTTPRLGSYTNLAQPQLSLGPQLHSQHSQSQSYAQAQGAYQAQAQAQQPIQSQYSGLQSGGDLSGPQWYYKDTTGAEQGPFLNHMMYSWHTQGFFSESFQLRRQEDDEFVALRELQVASGNLYPFSLLLTAAGWQQLFDRIRQSKAAPPGFSQQQQQQQQTQQQNGIQQNGAQQKVAQKDSAQQYGVQQAELAAVGSAPEPVLPSAPELTFDAKNNAETEAAETEAAETAVAETAVAEKQPDSQSEPVQSPVSVPEPVANPIIKPVANPIAKPAAKPVAKPIAKPNKSAATVKAATVKAEPVERKKERKTTLAEKLDSLAMESRVAESTAESSLTSGSALNLHESQEVPSDSPQPYSMAETRSYEEAPWKSAAPSGPRVSLKELKEQAEKDAERKKKPTKPKIEGKLTGKMVSEPLSFEPVAAAPVQTGWATNNNGWVARKSIAQIQQETQAAKQKAAASRSLPNPAAHSVSSTVPGSMPTSVSSSSAATASSVSSFNGASTGSQGSAQMRSPVKPSVNRPATAQPVSKPAFTAANASSLAAPSGSMAPGSMASAPGSAPVKRMSVAEELIQWCRVTFKFDLDKGVDHDELLEIFLSLPVNKDGKDFVAESIYDYSKTLDGRRFASDFMQRRKEADKTLRPGETWRDVLSRSNPKIEVDPTFKVVTKKKTRLQRPE